MAIMTPAPNLRTLASLSMRCSKAAHSARLGPQRDHGEAPSFGGFQRCLHKILMLPAKLLERVKGIEPSYSAWKAAALPLSYTRISADQLTRRASGLNRYAPDPRCRPI